MNLLGVFAKHWTPGAVKTRLAVSIGHQAASRLYHAFVEQTLTRFRHVADTRVVAYWPPQHYEAFAPFQVLGWKIEPQHPGDLGERMRSFLDEALQAGARRVVLIGSDSPTLPVEYVQQALLLLETHAAVLGPTYDGGYYLVGVSENVPPIFEGVAWSTSQVWSQTLARLAASQTPFAILPEWYDVDDHSDLRRLQDDLVDLIKLDDAWRYLSDEVAKITF